MITSAHDELVDLQQLRRTAPATLKDWSLVVGFRTYTPPRTCAGKAWNVIPMVGDMLSKHHVMHCDILLKRPCTQQWCGSCGGVKPCGFCIPCKYCRLATTRGRAVPARHSHRRKAHVVTYSARDEGVICELDRIFYYNSFYRVMDVDEVRVLLVEEFFEAQLKQKYNFTAFWCNFVLCMRFCLPCGTYWEHIECRDPAHERSVSKRPWICSELVVVALALAKAPGFTPETGRPTREPCALTPDDVACIVIGGPHSNKYSPVSEADVQLVVDDDRIEEENVLLG